MPYSDPVKKKAWQEKHRIERAEKNAVRRKERESVLGHNTEQSLNWPKKLLTEVQSAWIAACIDCEGCIRVGSYWNVKRESYNFHVGVQLQMTDQSIPEKLKDICGGTVIFQKNKDPKRKDAWVWHIHANGARWLLPQIKPYLMVKVRQADLVLEFLTISKRGVSCRAEYNQRAQEIRLEMSKLNLRGVPTGVGKVTEPLIE